MIWQQTARNLLPYLTAQENVELPMALDGRPATAATRAPRLLELVGLAERRDHRPDRLSGGEQQRVAIAVALANEPEVLFADEPTGELDTTTSIEIFGLLRRVNEELGTTIVIVTHDALVSEQVQRTVAIRDGRTSTETVRRSARSDSGEHTLISEEFAVLDRAGRLQLPKAMVAALGLKDRVRLRLEDDHVGIWPDSAGRAGIDAGPAGLPAASATSGPMTMPEAPVGPAPGDRCGPRLSFRRLGRPRPARRQPGRACLASWSPCAAGPGAARRRS